MSPPRTSTPPPARDQWARLRFAVIGPLLASPPQPGQLQAALKALAERDWQHPISGKPRRFGVSTIERWYYQARRQHDPVGALKPKLRADAGRSRVISHALRTVLTEQYRAHPAWSLLLHYDNLAAKVAEAPALGPLPSYATVRRYCKACGLVRQPRRRQRATDGARRAAERLERREVRSFEVEHVHGLWHLDFHHGSRQVLSSDGQWRKPILLAILDDRSRLICHLQWYLDETTETLVHGLCQAFHKRALPRALMSDNGAAMTAAAFTEGLERLGILHQPTLPYSPHQNAKQEVFWAQVEGRLMAMLEGQPEINLRLLNEATLAWVEQEYHRRIHSELDQTPMAVYLNADEVGRPAPDNQALAAAFRQQVMRRQRRTDGTISLAGKRFEIPNAYRHLEQLCLRYAPWDLRTVSLVDARTGADLCRVHPLDKRANADQRRRALAPTLVSGDRPTPQPSSAPPPPGIAVLLKQLMREHAATGLPPAYLPRPEEE
ncbi:MAG: transposase [Wenzhouxiangella sp.]|nr:MAG: transposase [Wenzhouxiangella sp.]